MKTCIPTNAFHALYLKVHALNDKVVLQVFCLESCKVYTPNTLSTISVAPCIFHSLDESLI